MLKENSRLKFQNISAQTGKSEATIRNRVRNLEKIGIIKKYTIECNFNSSSKIFVTFKIEANLKKIKSILKDLEHMEEITDIWRLSGECGIFLKAEIPSIEYLNSFIEEKISSISGIKIVETCIITDIVK